ncbi:hypothetical protein ILUMI_27523, partial [Ignelater luminosus]
RYSPNNTDDYGYNSTSIQQNSMQSQDYNLDSDPLFYNSRPPNYYKQDYSSQNMWSGCNSNYNYNQQNVDNVDADYIQDPYYYNTQSPSRKMKGKQERRNDKCKIDLFSYSDMYLLYN